MNGHHSDHCRACKEHVRQLLIALFRDCRIGHQFPWPARPEAYGDTAVGAALERIRRALSDWRGHRRFIKSAQVPPCDFYVFDPPFILEFDESQHFTRARAIALALYPDALPLGYSVDQWRELCGVINAVDDEPIDRDERRAWYDTLRDLVPLVHGFRPTVRLYAGARTWCALDPSDARDLALFEEIITPRGAARGRFGL